MLGTFLGKEEEVENKQTKYLISNFPFFVPAGEEMELVFGLFIFRGLHGRKHFIRSSIHRSSVP